VADARLFAPGAGDVDPSEAREGVVAAILESTAAELRNLAAADRGDTFGDEGLLAYVQIRAGSREIARVRRGLERLVRSLEQSKPREANEAETQAASRAGRGVAPGGERTFRLTLAFFPLDATGSEQR
jgi:hypothetical protein